MNNINISNADSFSVADVGSASTGTPDNTLNDVFLNNVLVTKGTNGISNLRDHGKTSNSTKQPAFDKSKLVCDREVLMINTTRGHCQRADCQYNHSPSAVKDKRKEIVAAWNSNPSMLNNFNVVDWLHNDTYLSTDEEASVNALLQTLTHDMIDETDIDTNETLVGDSASL